MKAVDAHAYLEKCEPDEPVFILRGQDLLAAMMIFQWADQAERCGVNEKKVCGAIAVANDFVNWKNRRMPD